MSFHRDTRAGSMPITNEDLHINDVIIGRKKLAEKQVGNQLLELLAQQKTHEYRDAFYRQQKKLIAEDIIEEIKKLNPPGRFLEPEHKSKSVFYEIDHDESIIKVCLVLRTLVKKAGEGDSTTTDHPKNHNEQNIHKIEVTSSDNNVLTCSGSNEDLEKRELRGKHDLDKVTIAEQNLKEDMFVSMNLTHSDNEMKRTHQSVDSESSKKLKNEGDQVVLSISYLGKSYLARSTLGVDSRRHIKDIAELGEVDNGLEQLPNIVGNLLTRIEELEEESQLFR